MADQLCTTAQVKVRLGIAVGDTVDDALISELIDQVSSWIEDYTGRILVPVASADYYFDTRAGYVLRVPIGIRAVTFLGVATSSQPDSGGTYTTIPAADYLLRPKAQDAPSGWPFQEIWISRGTLTGTISKFATLANGAKVTMTAGFATTPLDVTAVAIDAVVAAKQAIGNGASSVIGADDLAIPPWSQFFSRGSPQRGTLDRYRYHTV
jgi:gp6-like head-tail connector protein